MTFYDDIACCACAFWCNLIAVLGFNYLNDIRFACMNVSSINTETLKNHLFKTHTHAQNNNRKIIEIRGDCHTGLLYSWQRDYI